MRNGKFTKRRGVAAKTMLLVLAAMLVVGCTIGGTLAWLTDKTESVVNTFTVGDVSITLKESPLNGDGSYGAPAEGTKNAYKMIPGTTYKKDPVVAVDAQSEDCYLFVKFEEAGNAADYITYTSTLTAENGWTQGTGDIPANVWYRVVNHDDEVRSWNLLAGDTITINAETVTKESMETAAQASLTYTAYAVQKDNIADAAAAWAKVPTA